MMHEEEETNEALAVIEKPEKLDAMAIQRPPDVVLKEAMKAAKALSKVIEGTAKKLTFNGKIYLQFENWQILGRFYGVTAVVRSAKYIEFGSGDDKVVGFEAAADALLVGSNQVISSAEAMCLNDEANWGGSGKKKPLFQLKSMAQTRACAKALRNVLAWVVVLAGYAPTPAEEMEQEAGTSSGIQAPKRKSEIKSGNGGLIDFQTQKKLFDAAAQRGLTRAEVMEIIGGFGYEQPGDIPLPMMGKIMAEIEAR